ncbi:Transmembrane domain-containing protein [Orpheovirus IHUMI-LCC2]|uniref:Transmembrane domain-containing protein n=1 Tax=Orpheovirus IHUMI-LCC2 TaxID=2023057 RepID=A0A2I2L3C1_9VIRU|nr:Transmembrane domain-containing protein [Orpheovirus IHUMI-LCC2]SNW62038.1 Transmembrane domain-containing protein [Orpheovirus IHUMI-LCC2]
MSLLSSINIIWADNPPYLSQGGTVNSLNHNFIPNDDLQLCDDVFSCMNTLCSLYNNRDIDASYVIINPLTVIKDIGCGNDMATYYILQNLNPTILSSYILIYVSILFHLFLIFLYRTCLKIKRTYNVIGYIPRVILIISYILYIYYTFRYSNYGNSLLIWDLSYKTVTTVVLIFELIINYMYNVKKERLSPPDMI